MAKLHYIYAIAIPCDLTTRCRDLLFHYTPRIEHLAFQPLPPSQGSSLQS
jgi:hypothetical protein